jgi:predicted nuclease of predicted toxin-antitoxin system
MAGKQTTLKFYTDTHIAKAVAVQLRSRGIEVIRCEEVGLAEADDTEHLEYAVSQRYTLVSHDLDFLNLHAVWSHQGLSHCGIILFSRQFQGNIGKLVTDLNEWHSLIAQGAGSVEADIYNTLIEITR